VPRKKPPFPAIHGAKVDPAGEHPVLDIRHWRQQFPLGEERREVFFVNGPGDLAQLEQARELAAKHGALGPSVPVDMFVWSHEIDMERPWLTRIGGRPWREKDRPWPKNKEGQPLIFLGQICLIDSHDVLAIPADELPGQVVLFFGEYNAGYASADDPTYFEWSPIHLKKPIEWFMDIPKGGMLPFCFQGVRYRTVQYTEFTEYAEAFKKAGYTKGGWQTGKAQATMIGAFSSIPQGWPWEKSCTERLVCSLSSFYFRDEWPLCDAPTGNPFISADGEPAWSSGCGALSLQMGDVGCFYVYRNANGEFAARYMCG